MKVWSPSRPVKKRPGVAGSLRYGVRRMLANGLGQWSREVTCLWWFGRVLGFDERLCVRLWLDLTRRKRCGGGGLSPGPERRVLLPGSAAMQMGSEVYTFAEKDGKSNAAS